MRYLKILALVGALLGMGLVSASNAQAQRFAIGVGVGPAYFGPAPECVYGYYPYYPYACAPYGYYGPSWFSGGIFIGAGPWFHGGFYGRPGFVGRGPGFVGRGPAVVGRGPVGGAVHGNAGFHAFNGGGGVRGGASVRGGGGAVHSAGGFHGGGGGGFHGGGRR